MPFRIAALTLLVTLAAAPHTAAQAPISARELAEYPLTAAAFGKFTHATRLLLGATRHQPRFIETPLFSKAILVSGDAPEMAAALQQRLDTDPLLATALFAADMSARDYTRFALTLFAARLAHGFVKSGVMRGVPAGVAETNVRFIETHAQAVATLLIEMGVQ